MEYEGKTRFLGCQYKGSVGDRKIKKWGTRYSERKLRPHNSHRKYFRPNPGRCSVKSAINRLRYSKTLTNIDYKEQFLAPLALPPGKITFRTHWIKSRDKI
jgi:hypothetical protein